MSQPLCSAADTSLFVDTDGKVALCCAGQHLGDLKKESLRDIFEKDEFKQVQKTLAEGKFPEFYCKTCANAEQKVPGSGYYHHINRYFPSYGFRQLHHVDIRWNNICNINCRYCDPLASSQWMKLLNIPLQSPKRDYNLEILEEIEKNKNNIKGISLLGGEPFLQKYNEQLFQIIDKNTKIDFVTNLSVDLENNKIYQLVKNFNNVYFNISFENIEDRFEYVRAGANWDRLKHNIKLLKRDFGKNIGAMSVYSIYSACNLTEFYEFCTDYDIPISWQHANYRAYSNPDPTDGIIVEGHNTPVINKAVDEIELVLKKFNKFEMHCNCKDYLEDMKRAITSKPVMEEKSRRFLEWVERNERLIPPKKSFNELWPELNYYLNQN